MPLLTSESKLKAAARVSMRRRSSPGADLVTWKKYRHNLGVRLTTLAESLSRLQWRPGPVRLQRIESFGGKVFQVAVPTVEDRIVHRAMRNCIEPILEVHAFRDFVSGFRPRRNRLTSVRQAMTYLEKGYSWVADLDVKNVSGGSTVDEAIDWLARWISDGSFLRLVRVALSGLPTPLCPGGGLTPLLINLRLVPIDFLVEHLPVIRFTDNYCVMGRSEEEARTAFRVIEKALAEHSLAISKSAIYKAPNPEDLFLFGG
jgi:RNA-directed DNA polymerase